MLIECPDRLIGTRVRIRSRRIEFVKNGPADFAFYRICEKRPPPSMRFADWFESALTNPPVLFLQSSKRSLAHYIAIIKMVLSLLAIIVGVPLSNGVVRGPYTFN